MIYGLVVAEVVVVPLSRLCILDFGTMMVELELVLYRQYRQTVLCTLTLSISVQN